jgi:hypothetical protein
VPHRSAECKSSAHLLTHASDSEGHSDHVLGRGGVGWPNSGVQEWQLCWCPLTPFLERDVHMKRIQVLVEHRHVRHRAHHFIHPCGRLCRLVDGPANRGLPMNHYFELHVLALTY